MTNGYDSAFSARYILHTLLTLKHLCAPAGCNSVSMMSASSCSMHTPISRGFSNTPGIASVDGDTVSAASTLGEKKTGNGLLHLIHTFPDWPKKLPVGDKFPKFINAQPLGVVVAGVTEAIV